MCVAGVSLSNWFRVFDDESQSHCISRLCFANAMRELPNPLHFEGE